MSGKTKILNFGKGRGEGVEASEASAASESVNETVAEAGAEAGAEAVAAETPVARLVGPRKPIDALQEARDLEDVAMAYSEVVRAIGVITKTTQAGEDSYAGLTLKEMSENLDRAWERWDHAQRRLLGQQRSA
jgi:hypothetical protein